MRQSKAATRFQQHEGAELKALYFDGQHDQTSTAEAATRQLRNTLLWWRNQEMNVIHFTPISGKDIDHVNELINVATGYGDSVHVLCCDGAAVNTVRSGGICRLSELIQVKNLVLWFVCQLYWNELVLREMFRELTAKPADLGYSRSP